MMCHIKDIARPKLAIPGLTTDFCDSYNVIVHGRKHKNHTQFAMLAVGPPGSQELTGHLARVAMASEARDWAATI